MFGVVSFNLPNYQELADLTDPTKTEYCERHGYKWLPLREARYSPVMGFNKIHYALDLFAQYPDMEWLLWSECDAMITNQTIRIEDKIDNNFHIVVPCDRSNINAGNVLFRNSEPGRAYLQMILDHEAAYATAPWAEQQVMIDTYSQCKDIVRITEQRHMNSYEPQLYNDLPDITKDFMGNSSVWEPGDWIIHWPGMTKTTRIMRAIEISKLIVR